jgi:hypothetical protein
VGSYDRRNRGSRGRVGGRERRLAGRSMRAGGCVVSKGLCPSLR